MIASEVRNQIKEVATQLLNDDKFLRNTFDYSCCTIQEEVVKTINMPPRDIIQIMKELGVEFTNQVLADSDTLGYALTDIQRHILETTIEHRSVQFIHIMATPDGFYVDDYAPYDPNRDLFVRARVKWLEFVIGKMS